MKFGFAAFVLESCLQKHLSSFSEQIQWFLSGIVFHFSTFLFWHWNSDECSHEFLYMINFLDELYSKYFTHWALFFWFMLVQQQSAIQPCVAEYRSEGVAINDTPSDHHLSHHLFHCSEIGMHDLYRADKLSANNGKFILLCIIPKMNL